MCSKDENRDERRYDWRIENTAAFDRTDGYSIMYHFSQFRKRTADESLHFKFVKAGVRNSRRDSNCTPLPNAPKSLLC